MGRSGRAFTALPCLQRCLQERICLHPSLDGAARCSILPACPAPGCGLSRALFALLRLDFAAAFRYHPMIYVLPPVALYTLFGKKPLLGSKTCERVLLWGTMALWAAVWLARLILHDPLVWGT